MDFQYWKDQICEAKTALKSFFSKAKDCEEQYYSTEKNYNILYPNAEVLVANLCNNSPKPDIQRRFLKRVEQDKARSNLYAEVAKVVSGSVEFVADISCVDDVIIANTRDAVVCGRGVSWVEYEPVIAKEEYQSDDGSIQEREFIKERKIVVDYLKPDEFLHSTADKKVDRWWVARRHLLTKKDIKQRFGYSPADAELQFETKDETQEKRGEVWEIWDKNKKERGFILLSDDRKKFLEVQPDPYHLEEFFPCSDICFISGKNGIPIPEYCIYRKRADLLEVIAKKTAEIEDEVKYVTIIGSQDKDATANLAHSKNGDILNLPTNDVNGSVSGAITTLPVAKAIGLLEHLSIQKERIKADIYDITGISDIIRGVTDARETAAAQVIKGVFGSLRFQSRQKQVHELRKRIYKIISEIICEHYDAETLSEITCTYLPTAEEKASAEYTLEQIRSQGIEIPQDKIDEMNEMISQPTWDDVMNVLRSDKLRNYTVDVETTSTVFDDKEQQTAAINALTTAYVALINQANTLASPELVKGFIPIMLMNLNNIKVSSAVSKQLVEALEGAFRDMDSKSKQPQAPDPAIIIAQQEAQLAGQKIQADVQKALINKDTDLKKLEVEAKRIDAEISKMQAEILIKQEEIRIKQQEADRKESELQMQYDLKVREIQEGVDINANISGDVAPIE